MAADAGPSEASGEDRRLLAPYASQESVLDALLAAQDAVYVKDREGRYLMVNAAGAASLGCEPGALLGKTDVDVFAGELGERLWRSDQELMTAGRARTVKEPVIVAGRLRTYLSTKAPLRDASGVVVGLIGVSTDATDLTETDDELARREAQLAEAQALTHVGSWEFDLRSGAVTWSDETYRIVGREPARFRPTPEAFSECVHPDDRQMLADEVARATQPGSDGRYAVQHRLIRPDGDLRICRVRGRVFFDIDGTALRMVGAVHDVTDQHRAAALPDDDRLRRILDGATEAFVAMNAGGFVTEWNRAAEEIFGWTREETLGCVLADRIIAPHLRDAHWQGLRRFLATGERSVLDRRLELDAIRRDGRQFPVELTISALMTDGRWEFHAFLRDVSERRRAENERDTLIDKLDHLSRTDALTGLLNRRAWEHELSRELARATRERGRLCVAMLDLDDFKAYNDEHGHQAGDELLRAVTQSWRSKLRTTDVLARYGGEEFAVAFPAWSIAAALRLVERLRSGVPAGQSCSAGLVTWDGTETAAQVVGRADEALYEAKRAGRDRTVTRS